MPGFDSDRLAALFAGLDSAALVLAVSGGPDSLALLHLAATWRAARPGTTLRVATVDHGLRPDATREAALVAAAASRLGLRHAVLTWLGEKPTARVQERARAARYALLAEHARLVGARHILTAHHADDQAETILMRLGRGSGLDGLVGMRRDTPLSDGVTLVRPLLAVPKRDLADLCRRVGQPVADDPSNSDPRFARVRLRGQADAAIRLGLDRDTLLRFARRMARAEAALEAEAHRLETCLPGQGNAGGGWRVSLAAVGTAPPEILQRVLRRAILRVAGSRPIRLDRLERLADAIHAALATSRALRSTLAGTRIVLDREAVLVIEAEPHRRRGRLVEDRRDTMSSAPRCSSPVP